MKPFKQILTAGLLAAAALTSFSLPAAAAQEEPSQRGFVRGTDYSLYQMNLYHSEIENMSQEDRSKLMAMQDKLMQMETDHAAAKMKMDMETEKTQRDIQMFIFSSSRARGQNAN